jgi:hypothetical protein
VAAGNPSLTVERGTAARNDCVDVGVVVQPLVSCVQHELRSRLELPGFPKRLVQGSPSGLEQQIVQGSTIAENQAGQPIWQGENDLKIVDFGQHQRLGLLQPVGTPSTTTLRTVAIDARIVNVALRMTLGTLVPTPF